MWLLLLQGRQQWGGGWEGSHLVNMAAIRWHECQIAVHQAGTVVLWLNHS